MVHRFLLPVLAGALALAACNGDGGGGGQAGGASVDAYCEAMRSFQDLQDDLGSPDLSDAATPEEQMEALRDTFAPLRDRVEELRDSAPGPIRDDINQLADAAIDLIDVFLEADSLQDLTDPSVGERLADLQTDVQDAQARVTEFTEEECGIDLDGGTPTTEE